MPIHNKLVRDLIPNIIEETGKKYSTRTRNRIDYIKELKKEKPRRAIGVFRSKSFLISSSK